MGVFTPEERENMAENQSLEPTFEDFANENGIIFWWASDFMKMLGYTSISAFQKPINRAMQACLSINIDCHDNFIKLDRVVDGVSFADYKLTRFACYMVAMNGDVKKPEVAAAQVYFAKRAEQMKLLLEGANDVDRLILRDEIKGGNKSLASAAKQAGVNNYGLFQDSGYRGMYNMSMKKVLEVKGLSPGDVLYDYMGKTELSANWFRITMTEERLKSSRIRNENAANQIHRLVGNDVRNMVKSNTGYNPEELPVERRLGEVSKELKKANRQLSKKDSSK